MKFIMTLEGKLVNLAQVTVIEYDSGIFGRITLQVVGDNRRFSITINEYKRIVEEFSL